MMINKIGKDIPEHISGIGNVRPYMGAFATVPQGRKTGPKITVNHPHSNKVLKTIDEAVDAVGLQDGMTVSFHHHLRNGDLVMKLVFDAIARKGIKNLTLAPSSLSAVQDVLLPYIEQGIITGLDTSGLRGKIGELVRRGQLTKPVIFRTHGGRVRAIESGDLHIDVAFLAAPCCDSSGNINGVDGPSACGSLGYAMADAAYADKVIAITDHLVEQHLQRVSIPQTQVNFVVQVENIGDPKGIATGSLRFTKDPRELLIAEYAADVIQYSGYFKPGFSLQVGSGGASLAVARFIRERMLEHSIIGGFGIGGITGAFTRMLQEGLFQTLYDVQDFDLTAIESLRTNPNHLEMSASYYANPYNCGPIVNDLDIVILSATEVDVDFNVNVLTDSNGKLIGALGGHPDTAAGANLTIVVTPLLRGRFPMVLQSVNTVCTPGETIDVIVTERGVAINPRRRDLIERLHDCDLPLVNIEDLHRMAIKLTGEPEPIHRRNDDVVGLVEYRDGTIIDVVYKAD